jgi:hypothetical protein
MSNNTELPYSNGRTLSEQELAVQTGSARFAITDVGVIGEIRKLTGKTALISEGTLEQPTEIIVYTLRRISDYIRQEISGATFLAFEPEEIETEPPYIWPGSSSWKWTQRLNTGDL